MPEPRADRPHVVIIGGGFGGLAAARRLAKAGVRITLLDRRNHHLFQPLLYQVATAALNPSDIAYPIRAALAKQANARVLLAEARAIDVAARPVVLDDGELHYDYLVVATGATHSYFGKDHWAEARARAQVDRGRAGDPAPHLPRLRGGRARVRSRRAARVADVRGGRRRPDRRRARRRARRDRAAHARERLPVDRSDRGPRRAVRGSGAGPARVPGEAVGSREARRSRAVTSRCGSARWSPRSTTAASP